MLNLKPIAFVVGSVVCAVGFLLFLPLITEIIYKTESWQSYVVPILLYVFESMSGITTTGATTLNNLDELPKGILIWRALLQWLGGIGIVVIALFVLPFLKVGGMQLFHLEGDDPYEKFLPK